MTLRARLLILSIATVAIIVVALLAVHVNSLIVNALSNVIDRSDVAGRQIQAFMRRRIEERLLAKGSLPQDATERKRLYASIVEEDEDLAAMLIEQMAESRSIVEIDIAGENGMILASSNPSQTGKPLVAKPSLAKLREENPTARVAAILSSRNDYETRIHFGDAESQRPLFTIQILVSPVLLRAAMLPELRGTALAAALSLIAAMLLAYVSAHVAMRPLREISETIDRLASGAGAESLSREREVAAVESKLNLLSEQFQSSQRDAESRRLVAITSLTSGVAHEIKNPLNSIALRLELLRARVAAGAEVDGEIDVLSQEVTRLDRVVKTFLDFTRPVEMAMEVISPATLCQEVLDFVQPEAEAASVKTELVPPVGVLTIRGDADLLKQALMNIVKNSIEAMPDGGTLTVTVSSRKGECEIAIKDTGTGIPPETREKIFQLYFSTKEKGTGIGLAMTFRAVQLHGGSISVESESGQGTTFLIRLPRLRMENRA